MTFGQAIGSGFRGLVRFDGRSRRKEFWLFYLFLMLVSIPLYILAMIPFFAMILPVLSDPIAVETGLLTDDQAAQVGVGTLLTLLLFFLVSLVVGFFLIAVWVRRLHDAGYSGHWLWFILAGLSIVPLILTFFDSVQGPNQWGDDPKAAERGGWAQQGYGQQQTYAQQSYAQQPYGQQPPVPPPAPPYAQQPPVAPPAPPYGQQPPAAPPAQQADPFLNPPQ